MQTSNTTAEKGEELADEHVEEIVNRIERLVSMGLPSCDECYSLDREDRPEDGEFWPSPLTIFVDIEGDTLVDWKNKKVCDFHTPAEGVADEAVATHRVRARSEFIGDEHPHNGAYCYNVISVEEV
ncbi:hypothetical protein [Halocatena marina]|uniref:hypothetical protein n=1 Tax=Halocatena marina TaxID=2934937 RepID=UPI00200E3200|nr:hypothetical protein [Halocatena marina]